MIGPRAGTRVWLAAGITDMRCGIDGLAVKVQTVLSEDPYAGHVFAFRGRRGDLVKLLWSDGDGMCLLTKRLERGRFVWPQADTGSVALSAAQLSMLLEGIDWRRPERTWQPRAAAKLGSVAVDGTSPVVSGTCCGHSHGHDDRRPVGQQRRPQRRGAAHAGVVEDRAADHRQAQVRTGLPAAHEVRPLQRTARTRAEPPRLLRRLLRLRMEPT